MTSFAYTLSHTFNGQFWSRKPKEKKTNTISLLLCLLH